MAGQVDLSETIARVVDANAASLVRVEARAQRSASGLVWAENGVVVTAHHVVESDEHVSVTLSDGRSLDATLVGRDPSTDVAVLKVEASGLKPVSWGDLAAVRVGHIAITLARPGRTARAAFGIIGALGTEEFRTPAGGKIDRYVQTDTRPLHGFSGGLVAGLDGLGIGLNSSGILRDVNVAIPAVTLRRVVDELLAHGQIRRGFIGVGVYPVRLGAGVEQKVGQRVGLIVVAVEAQSPADKSGILQGDVLVAVDGKPVSRPHDLSALLDEATGSERTVKVVRAGALIDVKVTPAQRG